ncbi:MAG: hypothetical protein ACRD0J_06810, partial [Acidimicrobiales bacterium]
ARAPAPAPPPAPPPARAVVARALELGLVVNAVAGDVVRLAPPLLITDEEVDLAVALLGRAVADVGAGWTAGRSGAAPDVGAGGTLGPSGAAPDVGAGAQSGHSFARYSGSTVPRLGPPGPDLPGGRA